MTTQAARNEYTAIPFAHLTPPAADSPQYARYLKAKQARADFQDWIDSKPGLRQALDLLWQHSPDDGDMTPEHIAGSEEAVRQINLVTTRDERNYIIKNTIWEYLEIEED